MFPSLAMIKRYKVQVCQYSPNVATFPIYSCCHTATKRPCDYESLFSGKRKPGEGIPPGMTDKCVICLFTISLQHQLIVPLLFGCFQFLEPFKDFLDLS